MEYILNIEPQPNEALEDYLENFPLTGRVASSLLEIAQEGLHSGYGWQSHTQDMLKVSRDWPDYLFTLFVHDNRVEYYKQGKWQVGKVRILVDPFDESKLL